MPVHWHFNMVGSHVPPFVTIAINATQNRKPLKSILSSKAFVVGFPNVNQVKEADYLGVETGYDADQLANIEFTTSKARTVNAPVINGTITFFGIRACSFCQKFYQNISGSKRFETEFDMLFIISAISLLVDLIACLEQLYIYHGQKFFLEYLSRQLGSV